MIFLTANADGEVRGMQLGAVAYLSKPLVAGELLSLVSANVRRSPGAAKPADA